MASEHPDQPLLSVRDLTVDFNTPDGTVHAVRGISYDVHPGRTLAIVGESGSGKSVSTQTITGLTRGARVGGSAVFQGQDLITASPGVMQALRGDKIGMIFQDPLSSLHPQYTVGRQIIEMIRAHHKEVAKATARERAIDLLKLVGIPQADQRVDQYSHQFSGGMRQRVMIAMAMANDPLLLVADEPTTALDVTVQAQVLAVMKRMQEQFGTAIILITHDLGVVADVADEVVVMYGGRAMEQATTTELFRNPRHPYTRGLLDSLPSATALGERLRPIPGSPPSLISVPPGCPFAPRCPDAMPRCSTTPPFAEVPGATGHRSACWLDQTTTTSQEVAS